MLDVPGYCGLKDERDLGICLVDVIRIFDQSGSHAIVVVFRYEEDISWWAGPLQGEKIMTAGF